MTCQLSDRVIPHGRAKTKVSVAVEALRDAILRGRFASGDRLVVGSLADGLQMSPTPVREALRLLEAEGLVVSLPNHGAVVQDAGEIDVDTFWTLRASMESLATKLAVPRFTASALSDLDELHLALQAAVAERDDGALTRANGGWHSMIYESCGSEYLLGMIRRLWLPFHWRGLWSDPRRDRSAQEHAAIMDAIHAGGATAAGRLMHTHIAGVHKAIVKEQSTATVV